MKRLVSVTCHGQGLLIEAATGATPRYWSQLVFWMMVGQFLELGTSPKGPRFVGFQPGGIWFSIPLTAPLSIFPGLKLGRLGRLGRSGSRAMRSASMAAAELDLTRTAAELDLTRAATRRVEIEAVRYMVRSVALLDG